MNSFDFNPVTRIVFGKNKEDELGNLLKEYGAKKVLLVYGSKSIFESGLYDKVTKILKENKIKFIEVGNIRPNPTRSQAMAGVYIAKKNKVNFVLAVGGGSVIDAAKSMACGYYYDGDVFDFNMKKLTPSKVLPIGVILTLSASGSECSNSCVISNDLTNKKAGFNHDLIRPKFAIENPELSFGVSKFQTGCGIVDIISHSFERYFANSEDDLLCDEISLGLIRNVVKNGRKCIANPHDFNARGEIMLASSLSHNDITNLGKEKRLTVHQIEHALSGIYPRIAHGEGLSVLLPLWLWAVKDYCFEKICRFGKEVFNLNNIEINTQSAIISIQKLSNFFEEIGMPTTFDELGITKNEIEDLVDLVTGKGTRELVHSVKPLSKDELMECFLHYGFKEEL